MKLTQNDVNNLSNILTICGLVDINSIAIENGRLGGVNTDRTCAIVVDKNIPDLPELKLGLTKINILRQRLDLLKLDPKLSVEAKEKTNGEISLLEIKGSNASVQFRATETSKIKYPTAINDEELKEVYINREQALLILSATRAMGCKKITIHIKKDGTVIFELPDNNSDVFTLTLDDKAKDLEGKGKACISYYFEDVFSPLLKTATAELPNEPVVLTICEASARITVMGYELTILAPLDSE